MDRLIIPGAVEGEVDPPSSKSYAQRAIAAALLADGASTLSCVELCDDTEAAFRVVETLGARVENTSSGTYVIHGRESYHLPLTYGEGTPPSQGGESLRAQEIPLLPEGGVAAQRADGVVGILDIGESGLSTRLFTPIAALGSTPVTIAGHGSILKRPMGMMIDPLRELGVEVRDKKGHLPLTVRGPMRGGEVSIDGSVSSQFLTGLLMALPLAAGDTTVRVTDLKSIPYIDMTIDVMDRFGIDIDHRDYEEFYIPGAQTYTPADFRIEGDWSAASCLLVAGATSGRVTIHNLNPTSLQADVRIIEALSHAGARIEQTLDSVTVSRRELRAFEFDATDCPDLFPALAALAASCEGTSTIIGTSRLTHKECDRAEAILSEYRKLGIEIDLSEDNVMYVEGGTIKGGVAVESFRDHRMAMSLAVAALKADAPVTIRDAECVSKSYGEFWNDYEQLRK